MDWHDGEVDGDTASTWLELDLIFYLHGGRPFSIQCGEKSPTAASIGQQRIFVEDDIARFKRAIRRISRYGVSPGQEAMFTAANTHRNRLVHMAVKNRRPQIKTSVRVDSATAKHVVRLILELKSVWSRSNAESLEAGTLRLMPKPLRMHSRAPMHVPREANLQNFTTVAKQDGVRKTWNVIMEEAFCPLCDGSKTSFRNLKASTGHTSWSCGWCKTTCPSSEWKCKCRRSWIKCEYHTLRRAPTNSSIKSSGCTTKKKTKANPRGTDKPFELKETQKEQPPLLRTRTVLSGYNFDLDVCTGRRARRDLQCRESGLELRTERSVSSGVSGTIAGSLWSKNAVFTNFHVRGGVAGTVADSLEHNPNVEDDTVISLSSSSDGEQEAFSSLGYHTRICFMGVSIQMFHQ